MVTSIVVRILTLLVIGAAACSAEVDYGDTTFACEATADCPPGHSCVGGFCVPPGGCPPQWWDCSFRSRLQLVLDHTGETLRDFPVPVFLDETRIDYASTQSGGQDVRLVAADGTELAFEIDVWSPQGRSVVWVRVPELASGAESLWLYYNNPSAVDVQAAAAVWQAGYRAVWHLGRDPAGPGPHALDSTASLNHGTSQGTMTSEDSVEGTLALANDFDGVDDYMRVPSSASLDITGTTITLSAWIKMTALQTVDAGVIVKSSPISGENYNYQLGVQGSNQANFRVRTAIGPAGDAYLTGITVLAVDRWYYLTGVYDGTTARVFVDGVEDGTLPHTGMILSTPEPLVLGRRAIGDERFFIGVIDDARVANVVRSLAWITTEYRAMTNALIEYGAEQRLP